MQKHLPQIDVLRGLAILAVIFYHCLEPVMGTTQVPWNGDWRSPLGWSQVVFYPMTLGWGGVALFFVISGFVIHHSVLARGQLNLRDFTSRRFWRIYPPYAVALLLFVGLSAAGVLSAATKWSIVSHAGLFHNVRNDWVFDINASFWSIAVEVQLYAIYPVLWWIRGRWGSGAMLVIAVMIEAAVRISTVLWFDGAAPAWLGMSPFAYWGSWALGAFLCDRFHQGRKVFRWHAATLAVLAAGILAASVYRPTSGHLFPVVALFSGVLLEAVIWREPLMSLRAISAVGVWSYSLYLFHQPFLGLLAGPVSRVPGGFVMRYVAVCLGATVAVFLCGPLLYRFLEKPSMALGKSLSSSSRLGSPRRSPEQTPVG